MKKLLAIALCAVVCWGMLGGCAGYKKANVAATTLPVFEFSQILCSGTPLTVTRLVTEEVSCLHDYTLSVNQAKAAEAAEIIVISGAGLEEFMEDVIRGKAVIDAAEGITLLCPEEHLDHEEEEDHSAHGHSHDSDPHIWLDPENAMIMAQNVCSGLCSQYPEHAEVIRGNLPQLLDDLAAVQKYGEDTLSNLSCRELITFHDGFAYFAKAYDLTILEAIEEESGSEASAKELIHLIEETAHHNLPALFTEVSGSVSAAGVISRETGAKVYALDMAMSGDSYFDAMYYNIDTIKEALG